MSSSVNPEKLEDLGCWIFWVRVCGRVWVDKIKVKNIK